MIPINAPKIRDLTSMFFYKKRIGDDLYFSDNTIPDVMKPYTDQFTGVHINKIVNIMISYKNGKTDYLEDKKIPYRVVRNTEGYLKEIDNYVDLYGKQTKVKINFGKRNKISRIYFVDQKFGLKNISFSSSNAEYTRITKIDFAENGNLSYKLTSEINMWMSNHGYKMGDILNMPPEDYNIMMFETTLKIRKT